jgi:hypothetical protein
MGKKERDHSSLTEKLNTNEDRRSTPSKHYTTEWLASQKPEEAPPTGNYYSIYFHQLNINSNF